MVYLDKKKSLKNLLLRFKEKARLSKSTLLTDNLRKYSCPITNDNNDYTYLVEKHSNVSSLIYNINPSFNKNHEEVNKNENDLDDKILVNKCHKKGFFVKINFPINPFINVFINYFFIFRLAKRC